MKKLSYLATAARGTESLVAEELEELGASGISAGHGIVRFQGDVELGWIACLKLRVAMRVLKPLAEFAAPDADALYAGVKKIRWEEHVTDRHTIAVDATVKDNPNLTHSHFVALKAKDAIVDQLRDQLGARPSVNAADPDVQIVLHVDGPRAMLSLDLSGEPLFKRGYRVRAGAAPLKETLAAAIVLSTTWGGRRPFVDPMCGSGTIVIEAALLASGRAPGRHRNFGFQRWPSWGRPQLERWKEILAEADGETTERGRTTIFASDAADDAVAAAQANAQAAKVFPMIEFRRRDVRSLTPTNPPGVIATNPPYGERVGGRGVELDALYKQMGERFRALKGHDVYVFMAHDEALLAALALTPIESKALWNGPLECRLHHFRVE